MDDYILILGAISFYGLCIHPFILLAIQEYERIKKLEEKDMKQKVKEYNERIN